MTLLDLTLPTPAENLACDEALLNFCEDTGAPNVLRFWQPRDCFVVVGYANKVDVEINMERCSAEKIPVLRRCSGGGTVVQGVGCLNYSLILNFAECTSMQTITRANAYIMEKNREVLQKHIGIEVKIEGHTDLAIRGLKFSGNAQRRKKAFLLFHGTFLLNFDISLIEHLLRMPSIQPEYRKNRSHMDFLANVPIRPETLKDLLRNAWNASEAFSPAPKIPQELIEKYRSEEWNQKF